MQTLHTQTPEIAPATAPLNAKVERIIPNIEWPVFAPTIAAVNDLRKSATRSSSAETT